MASSISKQNMLKKTLALLTNMLDVTLFVYFIFLPQIKLQSNFQTSVGFCTTILSMMSCQMMYICFNKQYLRFDMLPFVLSYLSILAWDLYEGPPAFGIRVKCEKPFTINTPTNRVCIFRPRRRSVDIKLFHTLNRIYLSNKSIYTSILL